MKALKRTALRYFDISPIIRESTAVFPGDRPFRRIETLGYSKGDHLELSHIETTVHIGAHADAPSHYHPKGASIEERRLDYYYGRCQVVAAKPVRGRLRTSDLKSPIRAERVLIKTRTFSDPDRWRNDFASLSPELIDTLSARGVVLVGIDTPSIDPWDSKMLESHKAVFAHDMSVLEGLVLDRVPEGLYTLAALPLRIAGADASPVRAILIR